MLYIPMEIGSSGLNPHAELKKNASKILFAPKSVS